MAIPPIPDVLLPAVRGTGFIPAFVPAVAAQSPTAVFSTIVNNAVSASAPIASGLAQALPQVDTAGLLDRAYFRDLVSGLQQVSPANDAVFRTPSFTSDLGIEALLGRTGLVAALQQADPRQTVNLYASALNLFNTLQALGDSTNDGEPGLGSLLDITA